MEGCHVEGLIPVWAKHTMGVLLFTNMFSQYCIPQVKGTLCMNALNTHYKMPCQEFEYDRIMPPTHGSNTKLVFGIGRLSKMHDLANPLNSGQYNVRYSDESWFLVSGNWMASVVTQFWFVYKASLVVHIIVRHQICMYTTVACALKLSICAKGTLCYLRTKSVLTYLGWVWLDNTGWVWFNTFMFCYLQVCNQYYVQLSQYYSINPFENWSYITIKCHLKILQYVENDFTLNKYFNSKIKIFNNAQIRNY